VASSDKEEPDRRCLGCPPLVEDAGLSELIRAAHLESRRTYGARRIHTYRWLRIIRERTMSAISTHAMKGVRHDRRFDLQLLQDHWEKHANADNFDEAHAIYHDDAILEWPQSGERFVGKETFRAMREGAPPLEFRTWRIIGTTTSGQPKI
jgi:hypothetical protein